MKLKRIFYSAAALAILGNSLSCSSHRHQISSHKPTGAELAQVPSWAHQDLNFFLHGSMSTEFVPEIVLRAFIRTYPDLFPNPDLSHLGLIPDPAFGWPVGFTRRPVPHLAGLSAVGINCAACHCDELNASDTAPIRILGVTSHFDAEGFYGAITAATFRTVDPANMKRFLAAYLALSDPPNAGPGQPL